VAVALLAAGDGKPPVPTFTDERDGKVYKIVKIGSQTWMAQNLNYAAKGSKCYDNKAENCAKYGRLYSWDAAMKACPAGFHVPSFAEWDTLQEFVGDEGFEAGRKLKSTIGWDDWKGKSGNGTDEYGFSALPGGGTLGTLGEPFTNTTGKRGDWWSATETEYCIDDQGNCFWDHAKSRGMGCYDGLLTWCYAAKGLFMSLRCVQDDEKEKRK